MKVIIRCSQCSYIDDNDVEILQYCDPIGPCVINNDKDQFQNYMCPKCNHITNVMINTIKEQFD